MLEILSGAGNTEDAMLISQFELQGEFDIEVWFNIDTFTDANYPATQFGVGVGFGDTVGITIDNYIVREASPGGQVFRVGYDRVYPVQAGSTSYAAPAAVMASGAFRLQRSFSTYFMYYYDPITFTNPPHWGWGASASPYNSPNGCSTCPARVILFANNHQGQITAQITDFKVREGLVKWLN